MAYQTFFFTWNFVKRLKQTFLQTNLFFQKMLADREPVQIQRRLIDLSKTENSALRLMYICQASYTWLVCPLDHKHKGKGLWFDSQQPFVSLSLSHTHIGLPQGLKVNFPTSISFIFIWESSRGLLTRSAYYKPLPWERKKKSTTYIWDCSSYGLTRVGQILTHLPD